jgi:hypothetical protein
MQRLIPLKGKHPDDNLLKVRAKMSKMTKYWPLTFNTTIVYNIRQYVDPILILTAKEEMSDEEVLQCQQCIYQLVGIESRHELSLNTQRTKGKRDDQYRLMWNELEVIVGLNGKTNGHKSILQCIRKVRTQSPEGSELEGGLRKMLEISDTPMLSTLRSSTDSPMSPPPLSDRLKGLKHRATMSLYDIMMSREQLIANKRLDFSGRLATPLGQVATLYPQFVAKEAQQNEMKG